MAGIKHSDQMEAWLQSFVTEGMTEEEANEIKIAKLTEKTNSYDLVSKVTAKLENGTYALTGDATVGSVIGKTDEASIVLFDTYLQQEYDSCQAADPDLSN
jgi:hypothetical protein